jgi:hypothetical protein
MLLLCGTAMMTRRNQHISGGRGLRLFPLLALAGAIAVAACGGSTHDDDGSEDAYGSGGADGSGGVAATGGAAFLGDGGTSGGFIPGSGGVGPRSVDDVLAWLERQGTQCNPSSASPTELPSGAESSCTVLDIGLPGVLEYTIDPSGLDLDRTGNGGRYQYKGCDEEDSSCVGQLEYTWEAEYLADNEWYVSITIMCCSTSCPRATSRREV